jgi:lipoprotein-releasing system permease protein
VSLKLITEIARSLLLARWRQTLVAAIGVTFSITMFIALLSFMGGLNKLLDGLVVNRTPHIRLYNDVEAAKHQPIELSPQFYGYHHFISSVRPVSKPLAIHNALPIMKVLEMNPQVMGVSPRVSTQVFYNVGATQLNGLVSGIDVIRENRLFSFSDYVTEGRFIDLKNTSNSILLGKGVAIKMLAHIGDVIHITTVTGEQFPLKVAGIYQTGLQQVDDEQSYVSVATAQKIMGASNNYITDIEVKLKDISQAPALARTYRQRFDVDAIDIQTANSEFETGNFIRTLISYSVGVTLLIVAGFGIYNILNMMIYEKLDTIAILKAVGFSAKDVNRIFNVIALSIGVFGGIFGLLLGYGLSAIVAHIPFNTTALPTIKTYPIDFNPRFYLTGGVFSIITTYLAGYFPSRKASRVDPVVIIRGK